MISFVHEYREGENLIYEVFHLFPKRMRSPVKCVYSTGYYKYRKSGMWKKAMPVPKGFQEYIKEYMALKEDKGIAGKVYEGNKYKRFLDYERRHCYEICNHKAGY